MKTDFPGTDSSVGAQPPAVSPVAVIDIGASAVRMTIAQKKEPGSFEVLEFLQQAVSLGKDTFSGGRIEKVRIEECVRALKSFRKILEEYAITRDNQVRAVATSAVREAENCDAFLDRIYMATGIHIEPLDEADVMRLTYLGVQSCIRNSPDLSGSDILAVEVGGGSTELLLIRDGNVVFSEGCRLGSLRTRLMIGELESSDEKRTRLMEAQIKRTVDQIRKGKTLGESASMLAIGADVRFAALRILPDWDQSAPARISVAALAKLAREFAGIDVNEIVRKYHVSFSDAETLGPALTVYVHLAKVFSLKHIFVTNISMRTGILMEMTMKEPWSGEFKEQIQRSALDLARKYQTDEAHVKQVAKLSLALFKELAGEHELPPRYELLLHVAALVHDVGLFISSRSHHKHSMYLLQNSEILGLNRRDIMLVSLVARYHRRACPKPLHEFYSTLSRNDRVIVSKLAAILRVADALDRSHVQRIDRIECSIAGDSFVITAPGAGDLTVEQLAIEQKGDLFENVYGMTVSLR